jgi:hypothetical protein
MLRRPSWRPLSFEARVYISVHQDQKSAGSHSLERGLQSSQEPAQGIERRGFSAQYARAREAQADCWASEIVDLADETLADANHVAKARLQIDARKWVASKLMPRKYGDRVSAELTGANGGPIIKTEQQFPELKDMSYEDLFTLREILTRRAAAAEDEGEGGAND